MEHFESEHYVFHFAAKSIAARDIEKISAMQEQCYRYICNVLHVEPPFKLEYYLCDSPEAVGSVYGDGEPCNGFAASPNKIYAVYNERIQCIGFHEDAHVISFSVNCPDCPAIREGLAMYFDRKWWGISNLEWTGFFIDTGRYLPIDRLLDKNFFFEQNCAITYPVMGAFTDWLIATYGAEKYMCFYKQQDMVQAMIQIYGLSPVELNQAFTNYVRLFAIDKILAQRMESLLSD